MKKTILLSLTLAFTLALSACGKTKEPEVTDNIIEVDMEKEIEESMKDITVEEITFEDIQEMEKEEFVENTEGKGRLYIPYVPNLLEQNTLTSKNSTLFSINEKDTLSFVGNTYQATTYQTGITYLPDSYIDIEKDTFRFTGGLYGIGADKENFDGSLIGVEVFDITFSENMNEPFHPKDVNLYNKYKFVVRGYYLSELLIKEDYEFTVLGDITLGMSAEDFYEIYGIGDNISGYHAYGDRYIILLVDIGISEKEGADPNKEVVKNIFVIARYLSEKEERMCGYLYE